jgi:hypothetical protein
MTVNMSRAEARQAEVAAREADRALADDTYLTATQVRRRYGGASTMWLHRRLHDGSGFPLPMRVGTRRLWRLGELVKWEKKQATAREAA